MLRYSKNPITADTVRELLHYDKNTGIFRWRATRSGVQTSGCVAGSICNGYRRITINRFEYMAHRLAWVYMTGEFPKNDIDHINGVPDDNSFINLRDVTCGENSKNLSIAKNNTSGVLGVSWREIGRTWRVQIQVEGEAIHLGYFKLKKDAIKARKLADIKYGFHANHGKNLRPNNQEDNTND